MGRSPRGRHARRSSRSRGDGGLGHRHERRGRAGERQARLLLPAEDLDRDARRRAQPRDQAIATGTTTWGALPKPVPVFVVYETAFADVDGKPRTLSELRGKKVFLATWASW